MKFHTVVFCLLVSFLAIGCQKDADVVAGDNTLNGAWELRQIDGSTTVNYAKDNGNILQLDQNIYKVYEGVKNVSNGSFTTIADTTVSTTVGLIIAKNQFANRIVFKDFNTKVFYQVSNDTLYLLQGYFPTDIGVKTTYVKIK